MKKCVAFQNLKLNSYFIFLNKPVGITSQQLLTQYKRSLPKGTKVGHHGTLDPFANGLMLVAVGEACKFISYVDDSQKTYVATLKLGEKTDTGDLTGKVIEERAVPCEASTQQGDGASFSPTETILREKINHIFREFIGVTEQIPPMYSAIKIDGVPLYKKARAGEVVERKPRPIEIFNLKLLNLTPSPIYTIQFEVTCSRGTYIRTLAEDIAERLGSVGHLTALTRTKLCGFSGSWCGDGATLQLGSTGSSEGGFEGVNQKIQIADLLRHHLRVDLNEEQKTLAYHGKIIPFAESVAHEQIVALFCQDQFLGMAVGIRDGLQVKRLISAVGEG